MKRIILCGIAMEANSFSPIPATCETFERGYAYSGSEVEKLKATTMDVSGFYERLEKEPDVEIVPGFVAYSGTSGPVRQMDFDLLSEKLFSSVRTAGKVDGVLMAMHGALQSEMIDDCDGYLIQGVREIVGPDVPIVAVFDLHACMTPKMMENLDGATGYMTYPHTDHNIAGYRAAESLLRILRGGVRPCRIYRELPFIMPVENCNTSSGPIVEAMARCKDLFARPCVLSGGLYLTQPWLDTAHLGCQMCLFVDGAEHIPACTEAVEGILQYIWEKREDFLVEIPGIDAALAEAVNMPKPCCVVELGDIVSAGGSGQSTVALRALLKLRPDMDVCLTLVDPASVQQAAAIGEGGEGTFLLGASDTGYRSHVKVDAKVIRLSDEPYANLGDTQKGVLTNGGMRALLKSGRIYVIVSEYCYCCHDRNALISMGLDPSAMGIIMQKTHQMFKAGYEGVMGSYLYADTEGDTDRNIPRLPFRRCMRPICPIDPMDIDAVSFNFPPRSIIKGQ